MKTTEEIIKVITHTLDQSKAEKIIHLPVEKMSTEFESMVICTATSQRHVNSLCKHLSEALRNIGVQVYTGKRSQDEWLVVDAGAMIIHIMTQAARDFYSLEELWQHPSK